MVKKLEKRPRHKKRALDLIIIIIMILLLVLSLLLFDKGKTCQMPCNILKYFTMEDRNVEIYELVSVPDLLNCL